MLSSVVTGADALLDIAALEACSKETTGESITSTVGVNDFLGRHDRSLESHDILTNCNADIISTASNDNHAVVSEVLLDLSCDSLSDSSRSILLPAHSGSNSSSLSLVAKDDIRIGKNAEERLGEELADERSRERNTERLVSRNGILRDMEERVGSNRQEVALDEVLLSRLPESLVLRLLEVLNVVLVGSSKVSNHGAVLSLDQDSAGTSGGSLVNQVLDTDTICSSALAKDLCVCIITNAAEVHSGTRLLEHPLSNADGVLARTTSYVLRGEGLLGDLFEEREVLVLSEDSVRALQAVPVKE